MKLIAGYMAIPLLFSILVASYAMITGKHNQAHFFGLALYGLLFYGVPYFTLTLLTLFLKIPPHLAHCGFIGVSIALLLITGMWLLPPDPSGLPLQWMGYWPLAAILGLVLVGAYIGFKKIQSS